MTPNQKLAEGVAQYANPDTRDMVLSACLTALDTVRKDTLEDVGKMKITKESHPFHANFKPIQGHVEGYNQAIAGIIKLANEIL